MPRSIVVLVAALILAQPFLRAGFFTPANCCGPVTTQVAHDGIQPADTCCAPAQLSDQDRQDSPERPPCSDDECPRLCCATAPAPAIVRPAPALACVLPIERLAPDVQRDPHASPHALGLDRPPKPALIS